MELNDFELAINTAQAELGIDFSNYSWILESEDGVPWMEAMHSLTYRQEGQTVSVTPDYYFQTIQIRFGSRIVARSFDAFSGWMSKVVTWINPEDYDGEYDGVNND